MPIAFWGPTAGTVTDVTSTVDVELRSIGGSTLTSGTIDVDIRTIGGVTQADGTIDVEIVSGTITAVPAGTQDVELRSIGGVTLTNGTIDVRDVAGIAGTQDVDIRTIGGSVVPSGPLPVDVQSWTPTSTQDVDIRTIGGVAQTTGTIDVEVVSGFPTGTQDIDIRTIGGSVVASGPLPIDVISGFPAGTQDINIVGSTSTVDMDIRTIGGVAQTTGTIDVNQVGGLGSGTGSPYYVRVQDGNGTTLADVDTVSADDKSNTLIGLVTNPRLFGYDGTSWDRLRTTSVLSGGTIDTGLLAVGRVPPADPVEKIKQFTAAASTVAVWTPAAGKRWNLTDFVISAKNASDVTLYDGTSSTKAEFYLAANGGVVMDLQTPFVSTGTNTSLRISLTASTLSITTSGYETS